jgi:hypothetical protein
MRSLFYTRFAAWSVPSLCTFLTVVNGSDNQESKIENNFSELYGARRATAPPCVSSRNEKNGAIIECQKAQTYMYFPCCRGSPASPRKFA